MHKEVLCNIAFQGLDIRLNLLYHQQFHCLFVSCRLSIHIDGHIHRQVSKALETIWASIFYQHTLIA